MPLGRAQEPFRRGRIFAPRFHGHGSQNIRTEGETATREPEPVESCSPGNVENSKMMPSTTEGPAQDSVSREPLWVQSVSPSSLREISTKPSATVTPSPEKAELKRIQRENDRLPPMHRLEEIRRNNRWCFIQRQKVLLHTSPSFYTSTLGRLFVNHCIPMYLLL